MSALLVSNSTDQSNWITPQEQLARLALPLAREWVEAKEGRFTNYGIMLEDDPTESQYFDRKSKYLERALVIHSVAGAILRRSFPEMRGVPSLMDIAIEQIIQPDPLPPILTNWYRALKRLSDVMPDLLPEKIPPLPKNIYSIINADCELCENQKKPDGSTYKVKDTRILNLIHDKSLNQLEACMKRYGDKIYGENSHPLRIRYYNSKTIHSKYGDTSASIHWELLTRGVLDKSRDKTYADQAALIADVSRKASVHYEIPKLIGCVASLLFHYVATEERLYTAGNHEDSASTWTSTRVQEVDLRTHLQVGDFSSAQLHIETDPSGGHGFNSIGAGALRRFEVNPESRVCTIM